MYINIRIYSLVFILGGPSIGSLIKLHFLFSVWGIPIAQSPGTSFLYGSRSLEFAKRSNVIHGDLLYSSLFSVELQIIMKIG